MIAPETLAAWTGITLTAEQIAVYEPAAVQRLSVDCGSLSDPARTQAVCYLIASSYSDTVKSEQFNSESIGGYSYSRKATVTSFWGDKYQALIESFGAAVPEISGSSGSAGVERVDKDVFKAIRGW